MNSKLLSQHIEDFVTWMRVERNLAQTTLDTWRPAARAYRDWLAARLGRDPELRDWLEEDHLCAYVVHLRDVNGNRPRSIRRAFSALRALGKFLVLKKRCKRNPALKVDIGKLDAEKLVITTDADVARIWPAIEEIADPERRAMASGIFHVLVHAGLRRQELLDLHVSDVDASRGILYVRSGKGRKGRDVPPVGGCMKALEAWLEVRPKVDHDWLWPIDRRRRMGEVVLKALLADVSYHARFPAAILPHSLRHNCATWLLNVAGWSLEDVKIFLGHRSVVTTARYTRSESKRLHALAAKTGRGPFAALRVDSEPPPPAPAPTGSAIHELAVALKEELTRMHEESGPGVKAPVLRLVGEEEGQHRKRQWHESW